MTACADSSDAQITAWLACVVRQESARLARKRSSVYAHELLILDDPLPEDGGSRLHLLTASSSDTAAQAEAQLFLEQMLSVLTEKQRDVILATVIRGLSEQTVATDFHISQQSIGRLKARALKKLRRYMDAVGCVQ